MFEYRVKACKAVKSHTKRNGGYADLEWFKNHISTCANCQPFQEVYDDLINNMEILQKKIRAANKQLLDEWRNDE